MSATGKKPRGRKPSRKRPDNLPDIAMELDAHGIQPDNMAVDGTTFSTPDEAELASGSGLEIDALELEDSGAPGHAGESSETYPPGSVEAIAHEWLSCRTSLRAKRIAGMKRKEADVEREFFLRSQLVAAIMRIED